jgi:hypothetical protein
MHGGDEFQPVSRAALEALDPERHNFVLLIEPQLATLRQALAARELPAEWSLEQEVTEDRRCRVELNFLHTGGTRVRLRVVRSGEAREPIIKAAGAYDVDAEADLDAPLDSLGDLFKWVCTQLAAGHDVSAAPPELAADAIERAFRLPVMTRGRQRVALLAGRLQNRFAMPGWRLEQLCWPNETTGELVARGPNCARVDVRFTLGTRGNRSQVGVDFQPADETDPANAKSVINELVQLLRATQSASSSVDAAP